jgi:hypothetical protein
MAYARRVCLAGLAVVLIVVLSGAQSSPTLSAPPGPSARVAADAPALPQSAASFKSSRTYPKVPEPVRLRIPALQVESRLDGMGLQPDGSVEVPDRADRAGWYDRGPRPGQNGPAVILGHVDSKKGPGIFFDLVNVKPGTLVHVDRSDGSTATFRVTHLERVAKTEFPTDLVYAPSLDPTLRLVTCGGSFDHARGSYRDNVIAFADLV